MLELEVVKEPAEPSCEQLRRLDRDANRLERVWLLGTAKAAAAPLAVLFMLGGLHSFQQQAGSEQSPSPYPTLIFLMLSSLLALTSIRVLVGRWHKLQRRTRLAELSAPRKRHCRKCHSALPLSANGRTRCEECHSLNVVSWSMHVLSRQAEQTVRSLTLGMLFVVALMVWGFKR